VAGFEREVREVCRAARHASRELVRADRERKDLALLAIAQQIRLGRDDILAANHEDLERARDLSPALLDRLVLDPARLEAMAEATVQVARLPDPVGTIVDETVRPNGLRVRRVRAPIGVVAMIYEARPNVTADASALCLKSGNAVVLRGGSEASRSNAAIGQAIQRGLAHAGFPREAVQLLPFTEHDAIRALVRQTDDVDVVIPRGGEALIRFVEEHARVPVIKHYKGVCHLYVDRGADLEMAVRLATNAKLQRPGVCNAMECLLVDSADAARLLPPLARALTGGGCEIRGCERSLAILGATVGARVRPAAPSDYGCEFLEKIVAVRVVDGLDGALDHVARYGSCHTEAICTPDAGHAERWRREVDAACVVVNASTRFHDGGELGLGAEIGIATSRLHWRGAMGLEALTTAKWIVDGDGQVRA
jgi:glutamate-5-semialdehyde dehydrogenase